MSDPHSIVLVEDEWLLRIDAQDHLEDSGWSVTACADPVQAETALRASPAPDLLVTDIRLGGTVTGWDIAELARSLHPDIAVIYLTANSPEPGRMVAGSVFLAKPMRSQQLCAAAATLLESPR